MWPPWRLKALIVIIAGLADVSCKFIVYFRLLYGIVRLHRVEIGCLRQGYELTASFNAVLVYENTILYVTIKTLVWSKNPVGKKESNRERY